MSRARPRRSDCPVHFALEVFGDRWTLLIVRDLMFKDRATYSEFLRAEEGIATNILADRLERIEASGIATRDAATGRYRLTARGVDLLPVMLEIIVWSARHDPSSAAEAGFVSRATTDRASLLAELRARLAIDSSGAP